MINTLKDIKRIINQSLETKKVKATPLVSQFQEVIMSFYNDYISKKYDLCFKEVEDLLNIYQKVLAQEESGIKPDYKKMDLRYALKTREIDNDFLINPFILLSGDVHLGLQNLLSKNIFL